MTRRQVYVRSLLIGWSVLGLGLATQFNACSKVGFEVSNLAGKLQAASLSAVMINDGAQYTKSSTVTLTLMSSGASEMFVSDDPNCLVGSWEPYRRNRSWTLSAVNQSAAVYAKYRSPDFGDTACVTASIVHDDIAPVVIVDAALPAISNDAVVGSTFHATDVGSGVDKLFCIFPGQTSAVPCNGLYSETVVGNGGYRVKFLATDLAGNESAPIEQTFTVDTTPPVISLNTKPLALTSDMNAKFEFSATDNLTGISKYECKRETGVYQNCSSGLQYSNVGLGSHKFYVRAFDGVGNASSAILYTWEVGTNNATIQFTQTPNALTNSPQAVFGFVGSEYNGTPLTQFQCRIDGGSFGSCSNPSTLTGLVQGQHTFGVRGVSGFGGYSSELTYDWRIDLTPPVVSITQGPDQLTNSNSASFNFSVTDDTGVGAVTCSLNGGSASDCSSMIASYSGLAGDAQHSFVVRAVDSAGNAAVSAPYMWEIDNTPPTVRIVSASQALTANSNSSFVLAGTDLHGPVTFQCRMDSDPVFAACPANVSYPNVTDGTHNFYVRSRDAAGNFSTIANHTWTVLTIGPEINFTRTPNDGTLNTDPSVLTYDITDSAGVAAVVCKLDNVAVTCPKPSGSITIPPQVKGPHTITIVATNTLGTSSTKSHTFTVREATCVTNITSTTIPTKMLFIVDMSGSNQSSATCTLGSSCTDPKKQMRAGSIQAFYNDFGPKATFSWAFNIFQSSSSTSLINDGSSSAPKFKASSSMQTAINAFKNMSDGGATPYGAALDLATTAISNDPDLNITTNAPQYIVVFMSDGMPSDNNKTTIINKVKSIVGLRPGRISFNTIYYGPGGSSSATAVGLVQDMASAGGGNFLNTNTNPTGLNFQISDLVNVPVTTCN